MSQTSPSWIDEDLVQFQDMARKFIEKEVVPHEMAWAKQNHVDREIWNRFC